MYFLTSIPFINFRESKISEANDFCPQINTDYFIH